MEPTYGLVDILKPTYTTHVSFGIITLPAGLARNLKYMSTRLGITQHFLRCHAYVTLKLVTYNKTARTQSVPQIRRNAILDAKDQLYTSITIPCLRTNHCETDGASSVPNSSTWLDFSLSYDQTNPNPGPLSPPLSPTPRDGAQD